MSKKTPKMTDKVPFYTHRPFLVVDLYRRPGKTARTGRKGWGDDPSAWDVAENPYVVDKLTDKHLCSASAIIDILGRKMVKNRFQETSAEDVQAHYLDKYAEKINEAVMIWQRRGGRLHATMPVPAPVPSKPVQHSGITVTI